MIGIARSVALAMDAGNILDTIVYYIALFLEKMPSVIQAPLMFWAHTIINFFVTSGSGQMLQCRSSFRLLTLLA